MRELKNIAEQISVLSTDPHVSSANDLRQFLPEKIMNRLPVLAHAAAAATANEFANEREILYKLFFDMKKDVTELKKMFVDILQNPSMAAHASDFTKDTVLHEYNGHQQRCSTSSCAIARAAAICLTRSRAWRATRSFIQTVIFITMKKWRKR